MSEFDNQIPPAQRIRFPIPDDFSPQQAQLIREGKIMPLPETMMSYPAAFQAMLDRITSEMDDKKKMQFLPLVEKFITELDDEMGRRVETATSAEAAIKIMFGPTTQIGMTISQILFTGGISIATALTFLSVVGVRSILLKGAKTVHTQEKQIYERLRGSIIAAMRPREEPEMA